MVKFLCLLYPNHENCQTRYTGLEISGMIKSVAKKAAQGLRRRKKMRYGKIRIEDGFFVFTRHMMLNSLPCKDILWAYMRREGTDKTGEKQLIINYLVIITRRQKRYKFDMTEQEVQDCLQLLKVLNPDLAVGFPKGSRLPLQNLPNTRDLGALMTVDGSHILPRKLLRSGEIYHASAADNRILSEEYNVKTVIDFRSAAEVKKKPDDIMAGVEYYHIPIRDEDSSGNSFFEHVMSCYGDVDQYMQDWYRNFVTDEYSLKQYARFLDVLLHVKNGAVVFHSATGEDRTGVGTALLLFALGVPKETIRRDYMRSNPCLEDELKYMCRLYRADRPENSRKLADLKAFYQVKESYINTVFDVIEKTSSCFLCRLKGCRTFTDKFQQFFCCFFVHNLLLCRPGNIQAVMLLPIIRQNFFQGNISDFCTLSYPHMLHKLIPKLICEHSIN